MKEVQLVMAGRHYVWMGLGAVLLAILALGWFKGGEQELHDISVPVTLPVTGQPVEQGQ